MTPKEAKNEIIKKFLTEFTGQFPIAVTGRRFNNPPSPIPWARISVIFNDGLQSTLGKVGSRKFIKTGFIVVQVFTPVNKGTDRNDEIAFDALVLLDGVSIGSQLWTYNGRIDTIGDKDEYYQQNVVVEFNVEDIR